MHTDVNAGKPLELKDKDTFTLVAGDVSGNPIKACEWLHDNVRNGIVVGGNHMVYNKMNMTVESLREYFTMEMPPESNLTYLDCLATDGTFFKEVNGIMFLGSTLYTDYKLPLPSYFDSSSDEKTIMSNMLEGRRFLNDFRWGRVRKDGYADDDETEPLTPEHYLKWFNETLEKFDNKLMDVEHNSPGMSVVIVTHHCPSTKCIAPYYRDSYVNASFVSDLEWFIKKHPSIKLWACGHVHNRFVFNVGQCLVVANPRGYCRAREDGEWNQDLTVNSDVWQLINKSED